MTYQSLTALAKLLENEIIARIVDERIAVYANINITDAYILVKIGGPLAGESEGKAADAPSLRERYKVTYFKSDNNADTTMIVFNPSKASLDLMIDASMNAYFNRPTNQTKHFVEDHLNRNTRSKLAVEGLKTIRRTK